MAATDGAAARAPTAGGAPVPLLSPSASAAAAMLAVAAGAASAVASGSGNRDGVVAGAAWSDGGSAASGSSAGGSDSAAVQHAHIVAAPSPLSGALSVPAPALAAASPRAALRSRGARSSGSGGRQRRRRSSLGGAGGGLALLGRLRALQCLELEADESLLLGAAPRAAATREAVRALPALREVALTVRTDRKAAGVAGLASELALWLAPAPPAWCDLQIAIKGPGAYGVARRDAAARLAAALPRARFGERPAAAGAGGGAR